MNKIEQVTTTLNQIHRYHPCLPGMHRLLRSLHRAYPDFEDYNNNWRPIPFTFILDSNGLYDTIWALRIIWHSHNPLCQEYIKFVYSRAYELLAGEELEIVQYHLVSLSEYKSEITASDLLSRQVGKLDIAWRGVCAENIRLEKFSSHDNEQALHTEFLRNLFSNYQES